MTTTKQIIHSNMYRNIKKYAVRRITFHGKYIVQWYDGKNWRTHSVHTSK
jgi:hypothetical protein